AREVCVDQFPGSLLDIAPGLCGPIEKTMLKRVGVPGPIMLNGDNAIPFDASIALTLQHVRADEITSVLIFSEHVGSPGYVAWLRLSTLGREYCTQSVMLTRMPRLDGKVSRSHTCTATRSGEMGRGELQ